MRIFILAALAALAACSGTTAPQTHAKAIDPATRIHILNQLDPATAMGRAQWNVFALIYSADPNQAGVANTGPVCVGYAADSIGQRQVIVLGLADTLNPGAFSTASTIAAQWYAGNHTLPTGWVALASDSVDWGISTQFDQGHGRTSQDPIRWDLIWSGTGVTRVEAPSDTAVCQV